MPLAVLPWVTYLALPISVHPLLILLPSAALLGLAVSLTAGSFKESTSRPSIRSSAGSYCLRPEYASDRHDQAIADHTGMARWWLRSWLRAAHRGVPTFLVTAPRCWGQSPMALAESPAQRQELVAALRQLDALERTVVRAAPRMPDPAGRALPLRLPAAAG